MDDADYIIDLIPPDRHTRVWACKNITDDLIGRRISIDRAHGCAMHHDIADFQFFKIQQTAKLITIFLDQRFIAVQHFDRTAQFFLCGKHRTAGCEINTEQSENFAHDPVHQPRNRAEKSYNR